MQSSFLELYVWILCSLVRPHLCAGLIYVYIVYAKVKGSWLAPGSLFFAPLNILYQQLTSRPPTGCPQALCPRRRAGLDVSYACRLPRR